MDLLSHAVYGKGEMFGTLISVVGIAISLVLFLFEWRRTIGAQRVRISAINDELKRVLIGRVVLEKYKPTILDISRLIEGKATDNKVSSGDLLSERQILNIMFARIFENELIPVEQKEEILKRIENAFAVEERSVAIEAITSPRLRNVWLLDLKSRTQAYIGILASITGAVASGVLASAIYPLVKQVAIWPSELPLKLIETAGGSLLAILMASIFLAARNSLEQKYTKGGEASSYLQFENQVLRTIRKSRASLATKVTSADGLFDFLVDFKGKRIGIEAKNWIEPLPRGIVEEALKRMRTALERSKADEAILVTRGYLPPISLAEVGNLKIVTLQELETYLK
jgi:hypothetical protein